RRRHGHVHGHGHLRCPGGGRCQCEHARVDHPAVAQAGECRSVDVPGLQRHEDLASRGAGGRQAAAPALLVRRRGGGPGGGRGAEREAPGGRLSRDQGPAGQHGGEPWLWAAAAVRLLRGGSP
ncbi:unnamed protein product, partial [Prorocentrum cordatum]